MPAVEGEVVLDVIHRIQAGPAPDLACRWNCKAGKCGSCSAEINGLPRLMCMTRMDALPEGEPVDGGAHADLPHHPRPRHRRVVQLRPWPRQVPAFKPRDPEADGTYRMSRSTSSGARSSASASSASCARTSATSSATTRRTRPPTPGRACSSASRSSRSHPLDTNDRRELLRQRMGLGMCNITKCCTEVCPEHIKITDNAIIPLKERVVDASYDPVAWLGRKILRRTKRSAVEAALDAPGQYAPTRQEQLAPPPASATDRRAECPRLTGPAWPVTRFLSPRVGRGLQRSPGRRGASPPRAPRPAWPCATGASAWARS